MKNILKKEQGITLVALVTTIIILLILSGITIGALTSKKGLINEANQSSEAAQKESIIEKIEADLYSEKTITGKTPSKEKLIEIAGKYGTVEEETIKIQDTDYIIYFNEILGWRDNSITNKNLFMADKFISDGINYIDTGISLFSEENINKDFEISFEVIHVGSISEDEIIFNDSNGSDNKYQSMRCYLKSGWYCINARNSINGKYRYQDMVVASKKNTETNQYEFIKYKITIKRIYDEIIYIIDDGVEKIFLNSYNFFSPFNETLTFGAKLDSTNNPTNFFKGEITNIKVELADKPNYIETKTADYYKLEGNFKFRGNNYLDTGLSLFSSDNVNKNFEINFEINNLDENINQATLLNSMDESGSPYPGFVVRFSGTDNLAFKANASTSNRQEKTNSKDNVNKIKVRRYNKKLYYSINNGEEIELINFSDIAKTFNTHLTFGSSLTGNGSPQRYFNGILSNIYVKFTN